MTGALGSLWTAADHRGVPSKFRAAAIVAERKKIAEIVEEFIGKCKIRSPLVYDT
jgi:hypothetical protein